MAKEVNTELGTLSSTMMPDDFTDAYQATINVSQFGLKTSKDVATFLRSPAGEETLNEIGAEIAAEAEQLREQQFESREELLETHRLRAAVFLMLAGAKAHADEVKEEILAEQVSAHLKHSHKTQVAEPTKTENPYREQLLQADKDYAAAAKEINEQLEQAKQERAELEQEKAEIEQQVEQELGEVAQKYSTYEQGVDDLEQSLAQKDPLSADQLKEEIQTLSAQMDQQVDKINQVIEVDDNAKAMMDEYNTMNLKLATLKDMQAVEQGDKYYADADGNKVDSFADSSFILGHANGEKPGQKIVKDDDGQYYLLDADQDWDLVKNNPGELEAAKESYDRAKQDLMTVKKVVQHTRDSESKFVQEKVEVVDKKIEDNDQRQMGLANKLSLVQAARANALNALKDPKLDLDAVTNYSPQALQAVIQASPTGDRQGASKEIDARMQNNNPRFSPNAFLRSGGYLTVSQMQYLLKNIERFGVDIQKEQLLEPKTDPRPEKVQNAVLEPMKKAETKLENQQRNAQAVKADTPDQEQKEQEHQSPTPLPMKPQ